MGFFATAANIWDQVPWKGLFKAAGVFVSGSAGIVVLLAGRFFLRSENREKRLLAPRARLSIECDFHRLNEAHTLADVRFIVDNVGSSIRVATSMDFRIFGLREGRSPATYVSGDKATRLRFNDFEFRTTIDKVFSVEAGVKQAFPIEVLVPNNIAFVIVKVDMHTDDGKQGAATWFGESRLFRIDRPASAARRSRWW
jgi:hypothetical protein